MMGCVGADARAATEALEGRRLTIAEYEAQFEPALTLIGPAARVASQVDRRDLGPTEAATLIDAREGRTIFPMPENVRSFRDDADFTRFVERELGVDSIVRDEQGNPASFIGSYAMVGVTYWTDAETGVRYRVADPMKAYLAGVTGELRVGDQVRCLDLDGRCAAGERASYLEPEGEVTRPTHVSIVGNGGVAALFHSFYNKTYLPVFWARHGSNAGLNVAPLPDTFIAVGGNSFEWILNAGGWVPYGFPVEAGTNVQSVETAIWTPFPANSIFDALASCGVGMVMDIDVSAISVETGNGPNNNDACGI